MDVPPQIRHEECLIWRVELVYDKGHDPPFFRVVASPGLVLA